MPSPTGRIADDVEPFAMLIAAVLSAWLQYAADGQLHARAAVTSACPAATIDGREAAMTQRAAADAAFADVVCDVVVADGTATVAVGPRALPKVTRAPKIVVVLGDTGCRIKGSEVQACNDPVAWPFPTVAASIAAAKPDLIVHVGDYYYRETACPDEACAGPHGDTSFSWNADWFAPAAPLFAVAPIVAVRGNHEDCARGGRGWMRYLEPHDGTRCVATTEPYGVALDGLDLVVFDSSAGNDTDLDPALVTTYRAQFAQAAALARRPRTDTFFLTHRPTYTNVNLRTAEGSALAPFGALLVGHIHTFFAMNTASPSLPPVVVNGEGGDLLDSDVERVMSKIGDITVAGSPFFSPHFGFGVYTKTAGGWNISLRDIDGSERARCAITAGTVRC